MKESPEEVRGSFWPGVGVLLLCAVLVAGGYAVSLFRPPPPAAEVGVVVFAAPEPAPDWPFGDEP